MGERKDLCPDCNINRKFVSARRCQPCHYRARKTASEISEFEPQAIPIERESWEGRPYDDPRNNFQLPRSGYSPADPKRDLLEAPLRQAVFDVETTDLWAGMGRALCYSRLSWDPYEEKTLRADDFEPWRQGKRSNDKDLIIAVLQDLEQFDIVYGYNATNFDYPFIRTRAVHHGLPPVEPKKIVDPVLLARRVLRYRSNRLDDVARSMGCPYEKTEVDKQVWAMAMLDGDKGAMDEIVHHCELDVKVLAWVTRKIAPYVRQIDVLGSFRQ